MFPLLMGLATKPRRTATIYTACLTLAASACAPEPVASDFDDTGQLVALSGGDAGAQSACHTCHGLKGEGDGRLAPRLAGLNSGYLARQLIFFAEGQRQHDHMHWIARQLTPEQRIRVSAYYAALPAPPLEPDPSVTLECSPVAEALYMHGDPERGIEPCATCHGEDGRGIGQGNPSLLGQPAPYVAQQLHAWRSGKRYGDPLDVMLHPAQALEVDEIIPLAAYISRIEDGSDRREFPAECPRPRHPDPRNGA